MIFLSNYKPPLYSLLFNTYCRFMEAAPSSDEDEDLLMKKGGDMKVSNRYYMHFVRGTYCDFQSIA